jgi:glucose 1-dehydrogenase
MQNIPLHRLGQPSDVAEAVVFLASPGADYITGTTLFVDGGLLWNYHEQ